MADTSNPGALTPIVITDPKDTRLEGAVMPTFNKRFEGFEELSDLQGYLERNSDPNLQAKRPSQEMWVALQNQQGEVVAFANRQVSIITRDDGTKAATTQDNYIYVDGQGPNSERDRAVAKQLYAEADKATEKFVRDHNNGQALPTYNFAAETSPLLVPKNGVVREPEVKYGRDLARLADNGFGRVAARYLEASYDEVNGDPTKYYDQHAKLPKGETTLPTDVYKAHLQGMFDQSYPPGTSLDNSALRAMADSIARQGGQIPVLPASDLQVLMQQIEQIRKNLPERVGEQKGQPVGELTPELQIQAAKHYGNTLQDYKDVLPKAAELQERAQAATQGMQQPAASAQAPAGQQEQQQQQQQQQANATGKRGGRGG